MTYSEWLIKGRYVGHYRSTSGTPRGTPALDEMERQMVGELPVEAFELQIDGYTLNLTLALARPTGD